jgi:hypothetical protein
MNEHEIRFELPALLAGTLDPEAASAVRAHLDECSACRLDLEELARTISLLRDAPVEEIPPTSLENRVFSAAELESVGKMVAGAPLEYRPPAELALKSFAGTGLVGFKSQGRWPRIATLAAPALTAAVLVLGVFGVYWHAHAKHLEDSFGPEGQHIRSMRLADVRHQGASARADLWRVSNQNYRIVVHCEHLRATPLGYHYEVWFYGEHHRWSPAGSFRDCSRTLDETVGIDLLDYPFVEITLEPDDGNPAITGPTIMQASFTP